MIDKFKLKRKYYDIEGHQISVKSDEDIYDKYNETG